MLAEGTTTTMPIHPTPIRRRRPRFRLTRFLNVITVLVVLAVVAIGSGACGVSRRQLAIQQAEADAKAKEVDSFNQDLSTIAAQSASAPGDYRVGPEDLIEVTLYDIESQNGEPRVIVARVSNSGFITLPYVGKVKAEGFGPLELEEELRRSYLRFIHEPQITVFIREYRSFRVSVVGNVKNPGVLELRGRKSLLEAVAMSGGLTVDAGRSVRLTRASDNGLQSVLIDLDQLAESGDMRLNPSLLPGDVINVPKAGIFYVEGMVKKPGAYPLLTATTVTQALVTAGGIDPALARASGTTLYRKRANGQREAIEIDVNDIAAGKLTDTPVQAEDVIVVPVSGPKFVFEQITGLVRVGVNAVAF
ncbi:MAG: SLBB domain-containing protein [Deltaproteobacteria bacterium]|nr:SLBB domain-containing protein [Deltaproteobacteria bacterium]